MNPPFHKDALQHGGAALRALISTGVAYAGNAKDNVAQ
jgi:hypothetical protein